MSTTSRGKTRRTLMIYLDCIDSQEGIERGKIIDITYKGMLLISDKSIDTGKEVSCKVELPPTESFKDLFMNFEAVCRWSRKDEIRNIYYSGFEFNTKSENFDSAVDLLVEKIGFSDGQKKISVSIGESYYN